MNGTDEEMFEIDDDDNLLSKEQQEELQKAFDEIMEEAKEVVKDYTKNPSDMSGSYHYVNENSPIFKKKNVDKKK